MAVSPQLNAILLLHLRHIKTHLLPLSVTLQHVPQHLTLTSASFQSQTHPPPSPEISQEEQQRKYLEFSVQFTKCSWPNRTKRNDMEQDLDFAEAIRLVLDTQSVDQANGCKRRLIFSPYVSCITAVIAPFYSLYCTRVWVINFNIRLICIRGVH